MLYWGCAALPLAELGKIGASYDYWIEFAAATAILAPLGLWTWLRGASARALWLAVGILAVQLGWLRVLAARTLREHTRYRSVFIHPDPEASAAWEALVARVAAEPQMVLAFPSDVMVLADRPIQLEPYTYSMLATEGHWDVASVVDVVCNGVVGALVLDEPVERVVASWNDYTVWPAPLLTALRATMQLQAV